MIRRSGLVAAMAILAFSQTRAPERKVDVEGSAITSERDPRVKILLDEDARYMGGDRWNLYDVADCELHVFVDGSRHTKKVDRLYWIQFEQYLPDKPRARYQYDSPRRLTIDGMEFIVDTFVRAGRAPKGEGSDRERVEKIVADKGWKLPPEGMAYVRLVHLPDKERRKELMIIYGESLERIGHSADDLAEGGKAHALWKEIATMLEEQVKDRVAIREVTP